MHARETFGWLIVTNGFATGIFLVNVLIWSPNVPLILMLMAIGLAPVALRLIWPTLGQITFLSSWTMFLTLLTAGAVSVFLCYGVMKGQWWPIFPAGVLGWLATCGIRQEHQRYILFQRKIEHLCPECGYDLRASLKRCPECGTAIPDDYRYWLARDPTSAKPESAVEPIPENTFYIPAAADAGEPAKPASHARAESPRESNHRPVIKHRGQSKWQEAK